MKNKTIISFSEKKVSKNAFITFVLGIAELIGFIILMLISILTKGGLNIIGGLAGCLFVLLAFFGVIWGVLSYYYARTNQKYKISGICLNVIVIFMGITFIML